MTPTTFTFFTVPNDGVAPVLTLSPAHGETGVITTLSAVIINFNEVMDTSPTSTAGVLVSGPQLVAGDPVWSSGDTRLTIPMVAVLSPNEDYVISVTADLRDATGTSATPAFYTFTTTNDGGPAIPFPIPTDGATNVPVTLSQISIRSALGCWGGGNDLKFSFFELLNFDKLDRWSRDRRRLVLLLPVV